MARAMALICFTGKIRPVAVVMWLNTSIFVRGVMARSKSATISSGVAGGVGSGTFTILIFEPRGLLFPATPAARMLLIRQDGFVAFLHVQSIAHNIVGFGGVAQDRQLVAADVQERGHGVAQIVDACIFLVAEPRVGRFAKFLRAQHVFNRGAQHRQRRASNRAAVQIDVIACQQPLPPQLGPISLGIG